ncbi:hypothetical protein J416_06455 [Gracilibacillus halophilus YIM-C55.5]|uniref:DUF3889 domain-containing protein n=1 Tax=Gracilibacillus halophilus YIM-C55.5 TaxID=1308866 RepID=N4WDA3_9BACI|nr:DUF3889 domain-containing protein [Gracilibacillus halophilus]ENH97254.1 hypothetical protein J416_06455 [Gracilibacillus halophilus YIM-C55.5]
MHLYNQFSYQPLYSDDNNGLYPMNDPHMYRQNYMQGKATWTDGGSVTQCGIPWSYAQYMTVAVSTNSPYQCGQTIKVRNPQTSREVIVTVVDTVPNSPATTLNLHRRVFQMLGADLSQGIIAIQFQPNPQLEELQWGKYLLEVVQRAYPNYQVTDYNFVNRTQQNQNQTKEIYEYVLQSPQEQIKVRGTVVYNPATNRVVSLDIREV